uniref:Cadherin domain-containing protein n=1 Tax=Sinocyclocheilus rhinocerous TaxID=307959 RepID=A0A673GBQ4_9TELE
MFGLLFFVLMAHTAYGDVSYSFPEEMKRGSVIGNIAKDVGLDVNRLSSGNARIDTEGNRKRYCDINLNTGELIVAERIDREGLCGKKASCVIKQELVLENPLELHRFILNIEDINDNSPSFKQTLIHFEIRESTDKGSRYLLDEAHEADIGMNSVQSYKLDSNAHFLLNVVTRENGRKYGELVLDKELDREKQKEVTLILTAVDGGTPPRSGTVAIYITVLDANDNAPVFSQAVYKVSLPENSPVDTLVVTVSASDIDEGHNGEVTYEFGHLSETHQKTFSLDALSGEIKLTGLLDYEEESSVELPVQAKDGQGLARYSTVVIEVVDLNDNAPIIMVKSLKIPIPENALPGTEVGIINVQDRDSENNGQVRCSIQQNVPFKLVPSIKNYYSLVTTGELDRELLSDYNITITATDEGSPPLSSTKNIHLTVADVNDNPPVFQEQNYRAHVQENNKPGSSICSVSATDPDWRQNGTVVYSLLSSDVNGAPMSSFLSVNGDTGVIHANQSSVFVTLILTAVDGGTPPRSCTVDIHITVLDANDNAPVFSQAVYKVSLPENAPVDTVVVTVSATDADEGQNGEVTYAFSHLSEILKMPSAYLPPNYAELEGAGTLRSAYNYDAYLTTGSRTSDFKFIRSYNEGTLTADLTLKKTSLDDLEGLEAEINDSFQVGILVIFKRPFSRNGYSTEQVFLLLSMVLPGQLLLVFVFFSFRNCRPLYRVFFLSTINPVVFIISHSSVNVTAWFLLHKIILGIYQVRCMLQDLTLSEICTSCNFLILAHGVAVHLRNHACIQFTFPHPACDVMHRASACLVIENHRR